MYGQRELGNTSRDILATLAKGATGMIPVVGSLIAEIVGNIIPNQRVDRIVRFVQLLDARLGNLEQALLRSIVQALTESHGSCATLGCATEPRCGTARRAAHRGADACRDCADGTLSGFSMAVDDTNPG